MTHPDKEKKESPSLAPDRAPEVQQQLALALYESLAPQGKGIEDAPIEIGYAKARVFLDTRGMNLSGRRALDVIYFLASQAGETKYVTHYNKDGDTYYLVDLNFFRWVMGYTSNNFAHLRSVIRQGQSAAIEVVDELSASVFTDEKIAEPESDRQKGKLGSATKTGTSPTLSKEHKVRYVSVPLMGVAGIDNGLVQFQIPKPLDPYLRSPLSFDFLDLRCIFSTLRGRILYDVLQPYVEAGLTPWFKVDDLRSRMGCSTKAFRAYKYFKNRAVEKAIKDVSLNSDLRVEVQDLYSTGDAPRHVEALRFKIERVPRGEAERESFAAMSNRYQILRDEFGLSRTQLNEIVKKRDEWDDAQVDAAIEYTRYRAARGEVKTSAAGYFMKALREGYVLGSLQVQIDSAASKPTTRETSGADGAKGDAPPAAPPFKDDEARATRAEAGLRHLDGLDEKLRHELFTRYLSTSVARIAASGDQRTLASMALECLPECPLSRTEFGLFVFAHKHDE